ncbi:hypothetical protein ZIOFF_062478 [Zingiber officinale]|uniref:NAC domain-containing protein n=1 Tax=Zingiber officinale TaxID=94328 RepID=A0A8J5F0V9_ZINOF|nr:hypothetical protein ZIOFF_062478 [Zingiber officinale]
MGAEGSSKRIKQQAASTSGVTMLDISISKQVKWDQVTLEALLNKFHPTDEELVAQYLKRKAFSCPLPAAVILEINLSKFDPWDLSGENEGDRFFFNLVERSTYHRSNRATGSGYWKATGKPRPVVASASKELMGMKRVLVFHRWKSPRGS